MKEYLLLAVAATVLGCQKPAPPPAAPPAPAAPPSAAAKTEDVDACLDRVLGEAGLNRFGDPADTMYAGGSPLFDEASGRTTPRLDYVRAKRPDLAAKCAPP